MVATLNNILKSELIARDMRPTESLTKTIWEKCIFWRDAFGGKGWGFIWICDVHEDYVVVFLEDGIPLLKTKTFYAADPQFVKKVFQAIDKAIVRKP